MDYCRLTMKIRFLNTACIMSAISVVDSSDTPRVYHPVKVMISSPTLAHQWFIEHGYSIDELP